MREKASFLLTSMGFALFAGVSLSGFAQSAGAIPDGPLGQTYQWSMVFEDGFSTGSVDPAKWAPEIYWGITSNGGFENLSNLEWYFPANRSVANGILTIQARKENTVTSYGTFPYTSGMITSDRDTDTASVPAKFDFLYGYVEIRAKIPAGKGLWPAFWMLPSDHSTSEEIDIMEILGDRPDISYMTYHWGSSQSTGKSWTITGTDFSRGYHTYAVDWSADAIVWYIDGVERQRVTDVAILTHKSMFLIANLQVGGSWAGNPDTNTVFPANYAIDYIRVWKKGAAVVAPSNALITITVQ